MNTKPELPSRTMRRLATPENTAVITLLAYPSDKVPATYGFLYQSALRLRIPLMIFGRGESYDDGLSRPNRAVCSFFQKVERLGEHIRNLPAQAEYVLYVDARDCLFLRSLKAICDDFNSFHWPIVFSADKDCFPHYDPGWTARFKNQLSGYNWLTAGIFMAERRMLELAFEKLKEMSDRVHNDDVPSSASMHYKDDQHLWQALYVEETLPIKLDHQSKIFCNASLREVTDYDYTKSTDETPLVLRNGSTPSVIHFSGGGSTAIPYFAWCLNLVPLPK